ncbi:hypothetical protein [Consotaella salsifontis]|uniref:hypothetical protein n=1 Tax=Consotaella salsifontis TaxID=1365950 RepID=UPI001A95DE23|nr:hypothetical protein [Consotaella salsifontis]
MTTVKSIVDAQGKMKLPAGLRARVYHCLDDSSPQLTSTYFERSRTASSMG